MPINNYLVSRGGNVGFHAEMWLNAAMVSMSMIKTVIEHQFQNMKTSPRQIYLAILKNDLSWK